MPSLQSRPLPLAPEVLPDELAARLAGLPGFVYLDSADTAGGGASWSVLTALPRREIRGSFPGVSAIRDELSIWRGESDGGDLGVPGPGLYGYVTYEGYYHFGVYTGALAYHHPTGVWHGEGDYAELLAASESGLETGAKEDCTIDFQREISASQYENMIRTAKEYIAAGHIYQVNLAHRFSANPPRGLDPFSLYQKLRTVSPAPFAAYVDLGGTRILSSSPECFLSIAGDSVSTRPIKGTRPRYSDPDADERSAYELKTCAKEIAELVMITDLERNDLGMICRYGSVEVRDLLKLERYAQVFHQVSTVTGWLRPEVDHVEALLRCSPGGSISGAPKKRAREIIHELEPVERGIYTGSVGYFGFNGLSQFNIAIRTLIAPKTGRWHFHAGAGIVADSCPKLEYEETLHKASGLLLAAGP